MNQCQFQRGFFTLYKCDRSAVGQCETCQRYFCQDHFFAQAEPRLCASCAEKQNQNAVIFDDSWVYSYRKRYYNRGYSPFLYTHHDYNSFDNKGEDVADYDDDSAVNDFSDS